MCPCMQMYVYIVGVLSKSQFRTVLQEALKCWTHRLGDSQSVLLLHICNSVLCKRSLIAIGHRPILTIAIYMFMTH